MAVGAEKRTILRLVLRDVGVVLFVGCCAGVLLALGTTRLLATGTAVHGGPLLFGVQPHDLATLGLCVTLLATTSADRGISSGTQSFAPRPNAGAARGVKNGKSLGPQSCLQPPPHFCLNPYGGNFVARSRDREESGARA
jgi:hypothetical protein